MSGRELIIIDSFAGGGGTSTGIEMALGRSPDIAINHDDVALAMHAANHPATRHLPHNIWKVDPLQATGGAPVGLLWASPDCKHFSKAKGGRPVEQGIRDLAWVIVRWARQVRPRVIILENVEEFATWGPLGKDGRPCPQRLGQTFRRWLAELKGFGYQVEHRELVAADYGAPTVRKRLFLIARRDGQPIVWPSPTHAKVPGRLKRWRAAAEIIDWSLPCPSIFDSSVDIMAKHGVRAIRPLADNTLARIARGVQRYVLDAAEPFIVPITHTGDERVHGLGEPLRTVTTAHRGEHALIAPLVVKNYHGDGPDYGMTEPAKTVLTGQHHMLVAAFLAQHNTDMVGHDMRDPVSTIVQKGCTQAVVEASFISHHYTSNARGGDGDLAKPLKTVTAGGMHAAEVRAFLVKYYGAAIGQDAGAPLHAVTGNARFGLITVMIAGEPYAIVDIGMRMLTPRELFRAQGFPDDYVIDRTAEGAPITKTDQIRMCGNSVCPPVAAALVAANCSDLGVIREAAE